MRKAVPMATGHGLVTVVDTGVDLGEAHRFRLGEGVRASNLGVMRP
jgi:hypothetical protein